MALTPYADIDVLLDDLLRHIDITLGDNLAGLYLYGSLVTGDFDPNSSDIDLLVATHVDIDLHDFDALAHIHQIFVAKYPLWEGRIEIVYVSLRALKTFRTQASPIGVISPGEPFHIKQAGRDWLMNWWVVRENGIALYGPAPAAIIDPISTDEFLQEVREHAMMWRKRIQDSRQRPQQAYAILTMCRALYAYQIGAQASKKQAAEWAAEQMPQWAELIKDALIWRNEWRNEGVDHAATYDETVRFVNFVIDQMAV